MKVPENARELLESLAREHGALNTGADPAVPLWILTLALRALDYEAASGEVTEEMVEAVAVATMPMDGNVYEKARRRTVKAALEQHVAPLLSAGVRRKALEEAAKTACRTIRDRGAYGDDALASRVDEALSDLLGRPA